MEYLSYIIDIFLHLDKHLDQLFAHYGTWTYVALFMIVFCETGLVITPFLPGDSLLFAAGALSARGGLDPVIITISLWIAAVIGDAVNYSIGSYLGQRVFEPRYAKIFKPEYLKKTQEFYNKYGGKTIIIARFVPIIRTFAPFLAGVGSMKYSQFAVYNLAGATLWVGLFVWAGYFFGEMSFVKNNFTLVILGIIVVSIMPAVIEAWRMRKSETA